MKYMYLTCSLTEEMTPSVFSFFLNQKTVPKIFYISMVFNLKKNFYWVFERKLQKHFFASAE